MNELEPLETKLTALIANLSPVARKKMATDIARKLRASQQCNIKRQQAPDGTPFKPRKKQPLRSKNGRIRREMFAKLRTNKYLKAKGSNGYATVEFNGRVQRMAKIHHYGLVERSTYSGKDIKYESRKLLGLAPPEKIKIQEALLKLLL